MSNYREWKQKFNGQAKVVLDFSYKNIERLAYGLKDKIVDYTPVGNPALWKSLPHVDYTPGQLKAAWTIDTSSWSNTNGGTIYIYNDMPYALRVETGWSMQAPSGMMRRAIIDYTS